MEEQAKTLQDQIDEAFRQLKLPGLRVELFKLQALAAKPDFWNDAAAAQKISKKIAKLETRTEPWYKLAGEVDELVEFNKLNDTSMATELEDKYNKLLKTFTDLKEELKFNRTYDNHDAILTLSAGAGGTDAQDWTQMLFRMYIRWAEINGYKVITVDETSGEEAGLKSATVEIAGAFVYGKLKGEHGVHRLVRLSPFNADHLRQTSFAKVEVMPLIDQPDDLKLDDKDLKVDVYRSGGHGGQSVNTTDSAVRVTHLPTGLTVAIQNERSQLQNKETALTILRSKLAALQLEQHAEKLDELKGPNQSAEWGNQIRSYVLHPYKQVKDLRTKYETSDPEAVLNGGLDPLINAYLNFSLSSA